MATKRAIDQIRANAERTRDSLMKLKGELDMVTLSYNSMRAEQLRDENAKLRQAVALAKRKLIAEEVANGLPQIEIPDVRSPTKVPCPESFDVSAAVKQLTSTLALTELKLEKVQKVKKPKELQQPEAPIDIGRLDLRVAKVVEVKRHPDADALYQLSINCGDAQPRTVCSGLVKHIAMEELQNRYVLLLCNLKPAKMRGVTSEAMVMCASKGDKVEVISPPANCTAGDLVECAGYTRQPDLVMNPKKKIFETVAPDLHTNEKLQVCYKGVPLNVVRKGYFLSATLKNAAVK